MTHTPMPTSGEALSDYSETEIIDWSREWRERGAAPVRPLNWVLSAKYRPTGDALADFEYKLKAQKAWSKAHAIGAKVC